MCYSWKRDFFILYVLNGYDNDKVILQGVKDVTLLNTHSFILLHIALYLVYAV